MLDANGLIQAILSNTAESKRDVSWAAMERSAYKVYSVPKQCRPEKESEIVSKIKKGAFLFCSSQHSAEVVKWQNEGFCWIKEQFQKGRLEDLKKE